MRVKSNTQHENRGMMRTSHKIEAAIYTETILQSQHEWVKLYEAENVYATGE